MRLADMWEAQSDPLLDPEFDSNDSPVFAALHPDGWGHHDSYYAEGAGRKITVRGRKWLTSRIYGGEHGWFDFRWRYESEDVRQGRAVVQERESEPPRKTSGKPRRAKQEKRHRAKAKRCQMYNDNGVYGNHHGCPILWHLDRSATKRGDLVIPIPMERDATPDWWKNGAWGRLGAVRRHYASP